MVSMNHILTMVVRAFWDNEGNKMGCHDTQHNGTQHNDIQHNNKENATLGIMTLSIMAGCCYAVIQAGCHLC